MSRQSARPRSSGDGTLARVSKNSLLVLILPGLGAIFAGLAMAPAISGGFGAIIFLLIKLVVHIRRNPVEWAVWTSPFWFLLASSLCTLSIVYKGSPSLGLTTKPAWWKAAVILGTGGGVAILSAIFFLPYLYAKIIKRDATVKWYHVFLGPTLFSRPVVAEADRAHVPDYAVEQKDPDMEKATQPSQSLETPATLVGSDDETKTMPTVPQLPSSHLALSSESKTYEELVAEGQERFHAKLRKGRGPLGWAMRLLHDTPYGPGAIYELRNIRIFFKRLPAVITCGLLYGSHYDIHAAQTGISGTPEGDRMQRVYSYAQKYPNEVEHTYSFIQVITACTASFAHGANDIGNSVGPWAVIYSAWNTGDAAQSKAKVPVWQLAVLSGMVSIGLITYGFNIMKVMGNKITYHSPSRGCSMEMGAALTVLVFSTYSLPVSTSMCITGATIGVGLCNGTWRAVNWHRVALLGASWIATIPVAGTLGGVLMGIFINAPHFK